MNPHDKNWRADLNLDPDPGGPVLRLLLTAAFGVVCFGAGVLYQQSQPVKMKACVVEPPRKQSQLPKTKKEMAAFIQRYSNGGM